MLSKLKTVPILLAFLMALFLFQGTMVTHAQEEDDVLEGPDQPITGRALVRASAAALDYVGEGQVTDTEVGDEEGYYEIEVTLDNGQQVDVHLDENFNILSEEADSDEVEDEDEVAEETAMPLREVVSNFAAFNGESVMVEDKLGSLATLRGTPVGFTLGAERVLVLSTDPQGFSRSMLTQDAMLRVPGTVERFDIAALEEEFGVNLNDRRLASLQGTPVIRVAPSELEIADEEEDELEGPDQPITGTALARASAVALDYVGEGQVTDTEVGDEEGYYEIEVTLTNGRAIDVHLDENFNVLGVEADDAAADDEDEAGEAEDDVDAEDAAEGPDVPITGTALARASAAALDYLGEGRVTDTEVGDEEGYYEVEVTLDNGRHVDVHLDENFNVLGVEADGFDG